VTWNELRKSAKIKHWPVGCNLGREAHILAQYLNVYASYPQINLQQRRRDRYGLSEWGYARLAVVLFNVPEVDRHCRIRSAGWTPFKEVGRGLD